MKSKLRVAYFCHAQNYHIHRWTKALTQQGLDLKLITFRPDVGLALKQHKLEKGAKNLHLWDFYLARTQAQSVLDELQPDVVFASFANTYGWLASGLKTQAPVVVQTWSRDICSDHSVNLRERLIGQIIGKSVLRKADAITTDGPHYAGHLRRWLPEARTKFVLSTWWGIDTNFWVSNDAKKSKARRILNIPATAFVVLNVRGWYWYYQPENILPELLSALSSHEDLFILLPGLGHKPTSKVRDFLERLEKNERVRMVPSFLPKETMLRWWQASDAFISAPLFDGIPESVQEGMHTQTLPILNPIPANRQLIHHGAEALFLPSRKVNPGQLQKAIKQAIELSEAERSTILMRNKELIFFQHNVHKTAGKVAEMFRSLAG